MASMSIHFLDVGMGDGTLVQMRSGSDVNAPCEIALIDFGEMRTPSKIPYRDAMTYMVDFIGSNSKARGLPPFVDTLFLTHPDRDHYNKVAELTKQFTPPLKFGRVVFGGNEDEYGGLIAWLTSNGLVGNPPRALDACQRARNASTTPVPDWTFANGQVHVYLLSSNYPSTNAWAPNPKSLVLLFQCGDKKVILQGDAEADVEEQIIGHFNAQFLVATALKLGHHGSKGATSPAWIKAVKPQAIFASGDMCWAHPYGEAICRVLDAGCLRDGMTGFPVVWYCCGAGHGDNRIYWNNPTTKAVCLNLWYVVKDKPNEQLSYEFNHDKWETITEADGSTFGVQWLLYLPDKGSPEFGVTARALPASGRSPTPPFDCSSVRGPFLFVPSREPAGMA
jgi:competence protein ComEC